MLLISNCNQNDTVLITGASGGVGSATIQLAKLRGCNVIAIVSEEKSSYAIQAGADKVIPRNSNLLKVLGENNINLVVDVVGGKNFSDFLKIIAPGGRYVSAGAIGNPIVNFDLRDLYLKDISMFGCTTWEEQVFLNLIKYIENILYNVENSIFGYGFNQFAVVRSEVKPINEFSDNLRPTGPHNGYAFQLLNYGYVGLVLFLALVIYPLLRLNSYRVSYLAGTQNLLPISAFLVLNFAGDLFQNQSIAWIFWLYLFEFYKEHS